MKTVKFFYARTTLDLEVPDATPVLTSRIGELKSSGDGRDIVRRALEHPIDSPRLSELAQGKPDCVIIISDHTRPVPSRDILPAMIEELRRGNPSIDIKLLVATGFHRPTSVSELKEKLGDALYDEFKDKIIQGVAQFFLQFADTGGTPCMTNSRTRSSSTTPTIRLRT